MNPLVVMVLLIELVNAAPFSQNMKSDVFLPGKLAKRQACDLVESPLGRKYFRKTTPWGQVIDLPCQSGTLFEISACNCQKKRCAVLDSDPTSYIEFVDFIGDWVAGECPNGMVYKADFCMCSRQNDLTTVPLVTVKPEDCPYRKAGPSSYQEFFQSIQDWVTNDCPHGLVFIQKYCKCVSKDAQELNPLDTTTVSMATKPTVKPPTNCPYIKDGMSSYKEYVDSLGDWVTYYCSSGQIFSTTWCTCLVEGQIPDYSEVLPPVVTNCNYVPSGLSSYMEYVPEINAWVTNDCPAGKIYSQSHCTCVNRHLIRVTTTKPTASSTETVTNPNCDLKPVGKTSYQKFEESVQDWVTISCHAGLVFNVLLCHCVQDGVVVTSIPGSTSVHQGVTNPNCPYIPVNQRSYKEYVAAIAAWVTNDCPSDMVFDVIMCSCHPDGSAEIIVVPITTLPPLNIPTVPNCPHKKSADGYLEYVSELDIWINNVCAIDHEFVVEYCTCLSKSDVAKIPTVPSTTLATTTPQPSSPTTVSAPTTSSTTIDRSTNGITFTSSKASTIAKTTTSTTKPTTTTTKPTTTTAKPTATTTELTTTTTKPTTTTAKPTTTTTEPTTMTTKPTTMTTKPTTTTAKPTTTTAEPKTTMTSPTTTTAKLQTSSSTKPTPTSSNLTPPPNCDKIVSGLGNRYYETVVPGWGELTFMCQTGKIFYLPKCDCISVKDIPKTTKTLVQYPTTTSTRRKATTPVPTTTTTTIPTTTTTTMRTTTTPTPSTNEQTTKRVPSINKVCPLIPSTQGTEYFKIDLGTMGSIELMCPSMQKFVFDKCGCFRD